MILQTKLQVIQKELQETKEKRDLTEQEAAQLAAINAQLLADKEFFENTTNTLKEANDELTTRAERLLERQQLLEQCAESLKLENGILIQQFERLKLKHEQESAAFYEQMQALKSTISAQMHTFIQGEINASQLVEALKEIGVELSVTEQSVQALDQRLAVAATPEERVQVLEKVEIKVDVNWMEHMKLVTESPSRAARLMHQTASAKPVEAGPVKQTPRLEAATESKAAQLKLTSHAVLDENENQKDRISAVHSVNEDAQEVKPLAQKQTNKNRSLMFRAVKNKKNNEKELDLVLPLHQLATMDEGPMSNAMVAM